MITSFNYDFDIAALFIMLVIFILSWQQNFFKNKSYYIFTGVRISAVIMIIADIVSAIALEKNQEVLFLVSNSIFYLEEITVPYLFCSYAISPVINRQKPRKLQTILFNIPMAIAIILVLVNLFNNCLFKYDAVNRVYTYGPLEKLYYLLSPVYLLFAIYVCIRKKSIYNKKVMLAVVNGVILVSFFIIIGIFFPVVLTKGFATSLALLQIYLVAMTEHPKKSKLSGLIIGEEITKRSGILLHNKEMFSIILVRILDYELLMNAYGIKTIELFEKDICNKLKLQVPKNSGYKIDNDMIAMLIENKSEEEVYNIEQKINGFLSQKWSTEGMDISFSHCIVTFIAYKDFENLNELESLIYYIQKNNHLVSGVSHIDEFEMKKVKREHEVEAALRIALENNTFEMHYQPIYSVEKTRFVAAEALVRLMNTSIGVIGPAEFIPVAEKAGLINSLGSWILENVFRFISENDLELYGIEYIHVNLSTIQCMQRDLVTKVYQYKEKYRIKPSKICFEITENSSTNIPEAITVNLRALKDAGYKLTIDDFGTGYGNFERLFTTDFDMVKYDRNTAVHFYEDEKYHSLTARMSTMIHAMRCEVIAEGIETKEQYEFMELMGIDYIQGFYFSNALSEKDFIEFIRMKN